MAVCDAAAHFNVGGDFADMINLMWWKEAFMLPIEDNYCRINNMRRKSYNNIKDAENYFEKKHKSKVFMELEKC